MRPVLPPPSPSSWTWEGSQSVRNVSSMQGVPGSPPNIKGETSMMTVQAHRAEDAVPHIQEKSLFSELILLLHLCEIWGAKD